MRDDVDVYEMRVRVNVVLEMFVLGMKFNRMDCIPCWFGLSCLSLSLSLGRVLSEVFK